MSTGRSPRAARVERHLGRLTLTIGLYAVSAMAIGYSMGADSPGLMAASIALSCVAIWVMMKSVFRLLELVQEVLDEG